MKEILDCVSIIIEEISYWLNFLNMAQNERPDIDKDNLLYMMPHPLDEKNIIIGKKAHLAFYDMIESYIKNDIRFDIDKLVITLKKEFSKTLLAQQIDVEEKHVARLLARVTKHEIKSWKECTYYYPCNLFISDILQDIIIGPVHFISSEEFFKDNSDKFENDLSKYPPDKYSMTLDERNNTIKYFKKFNWISYIKLDNCAPSVGKKISREIIELAIATLQIIWGSTATKKFGIEVDSNAIDKQQLQQVDGVFEFSWSKEWPMHRYPPEWPSTFETPWHKIVITEAGHILTNLSKFKNIDTLSTLAIESLKMFQSSVQERDYHIRIMKLVISAETLLLPLPFYKSDISSLFKSRASSILSEDLNSYNDNISFFSKAYNIRSAVAHGRSRPKDITNNISSLKLEISVQNIFAWIVALFHHEEMIKGNMQKDKKLDKVLENSVSIFSHQTSSSTDTI